MKHEVALPPGFHFEELQFERDPAVGGFRVRNGTLLYEVLAYNGIGPELLNQYPSPSLILLHVVGSCYRVHIARGGAPNEIMEQLSARSIHP